MKTILLLLFFAVTQKVQKLRDKLKFFVLRMKYKWSWLRIIGSPFKFPKPIFYAGKKTIGRPYFITKKKIDFQVMGLMWKTKFDSYRHEYSPRIIFTFFDWQLAVFFGNNSMIDMSRWEAWLHYLDTPDTLDDVDRLEITRGQYSATWKGNEGTVNYYHHILKPRYLSNKNQKV